MIRIVYFILLIILFFSPYAYAECISQKQAINIASAELKAKGFNVRRLVISIDIDHLSWAKEVAANKEILRSINLSKKNLQKMNYWAVYFQPKADDIAGGDGWILINKENGTVIGSVFGE